jgi:hypothetical protein
MGKTREQRIEAVEAVLRRASAHNPEWCRRTAEDVLQELDPAVTAEQAGTVRQLVLSLFSAAEEGTGRYVDDEYVFVKGGEDEAMSESAKVICWEGGPENWPWLFSSAVFEDKVTLPDGVAVEAYTNWGLTVYPKARS